MSEAGPVLLVVRCRRRDHVVLEVTEEPGGLVIAAPLWCAGRRREQWTPASWPVSDPANRVRRAGCQCGQSWLIGGADILRWIGAGYATVVLPAARIGRIGPVRLGANNRSPRGPGVEIAHAPKPGLPRPGDKCRS